MSTTTKIAAAAAAVLLLAVVVLGALASVVTGMFGGSNQPSTTALADIPADQLALYQRAATVCPGLDWTVLAAIGKIESDHGRSTLPGVHTGENPYHAAGVMQIIPSTWDTILAQHQIPPGGAAPPSRYNPHDAIHAAAFLLCDNGARDSQDLPGAIFAYNHADWYVRQVLTQAAHYTDAASSAVLACRPTPAAPTPATTPPTAQSGPPTAHSGSNSQLIAIAFACAQLGKPYVWGGNGNSGFDCSGLTRAAYAAAGIDLPRTAQTQFNAGRRLPAGTPAQPGDLLFFGAPDHIHHVGISLGGTQMINAPTFGQPVQTDDYRDYPDFTGLTRPALTNR